MANGIINGLQENGEVFPGLSQSSGAYLEPTNHGEDSDDIVDADADQIMKPCCEHHKSESDHGVWESIRNRGGDNLFALRAPIAMHRVLRHFRFLNRGNVFGITFVFLNGFLERCLATRTTFKGVLFEMIDLLGLEAGNPLMAFLPSWSFWALLRVAL